MGDAVVLKTPVGAVASEARDAICEGLSPRSSRPGSCRSELALTSHQEFPTLLVVKRVVTKSVHSQTPKQTVAECSLKSDGEPSLDYPDELRQFASRAREAFLARRQRVNSRKSP